MQTLPAAAVFGLLPVPAMPDTACGSSGAQSTTIENSDVSQPLRAQPTRPSSLGHHLAALRDVLKGQPVHTLHPL